jgi:hypothetical protein
MKSLLANCTNKSVQVAIGTLFGDARPRVCELVGLESVGIWLVSEELTKLIYGNEANGAVPVFIPLAQVTFLVAGATPPARAVGTASSAPKKANARPQPEGKKIASSRSEAKRR